MSNKLDFDWNRMDAPVVLQQQRKTAIYMNPADDVVIRQEADWDEENDPFIVIGAQNLRRVIARLTELADELEDGEHHHADRQARDTTAAERQRRHRERKKHTGGNVVELPHAEAAE